MSTINEDLKPIKIGITGKMRSGKDQVADIITDELISLKLPSYKMGFADGITDLINDYIPIVMEEGKPREAYQDIGQTLRKYHENVWVDIAAKKLDHLSEVFPEVSVIVKDVRQPNEYQELKDRGYTIIKVEAVTELRVTRSLSNDDKFDVSHLYHETELAVDNMEADYVIENNGTLADLEKSSRDLLLTLLDKTMEGEITTDE